MICEFHPQIAWKSSVAIERDSIVFASTINGVSVFDGQTVMLTMLRLWIIIEFKK